MQSSRVEVPPLAAYAVADGLAYSWLPSEIVALAVSRPVMPRLRNNSPDPGTGYACRCDEDCVKTTTVETAERGRSPLGAHIRFLVEGPHGNMIHSAMLPGMVGRAFHFRTWVTRRT